jgi:hypothetical protein
MACMDEGERSTPAQARALFGRSWITGSRTEKGGAAAPPSRIQEQSAGQLKPAIFCIFFTSSGEIEKVRLI